VRDWKPVDETKVYDFDLRTDRKNTNSLKYDFAQENGYPADVLPLWVADMDFPTAQPILDALHRAVTHGIFGYTEVKADYFRAVAHWFERHFHWQTSPDWLVKTVCPCNCNPCVYRSR
jgi:cystathionine beta-lyase